MERVQSTSKLFEVNKSARVGEKRDEHRAERVHRKFRNLVELQRTIIVQGIFQLSTQKIGCMGMKRMKEGKKTKKNERKKGRGEGRVKERKQMSFKPDCSSSFSVQVQEPLIMSVELFQRICCSSQ